MNVQFLSNKRAIDNLFFFSSDTVFVNIHGNDSNPYTPGLVCNIQIACTTAINALPEIVEVNTLNSNAGLCLFFTLFS